MTIQTRPCFYYNYEVTELNFAIDFDEGSGELQASLRQGFYTLESLATELQRAMNASGTVREYEVTVDRNARVLTIEETSALTFNLLFASGSRSGITAAALISFQAVDTGLSGSHTGTEATGSVFEPQFLLQSYVDNVDFQESVSATRNESSAGIVEVCRFGIRNYIEFNITFQNNSTQKNLGPIEYNETGKDDLVDFLRWVTQIGGIEMMKDRNNKDSFISLLIERTPTSTSGTGYRLRELYNRGLPGFFETGVLRFRVLDNSNC